MSRAQAESVIKNIIREIAQECASKGQAVSETLVAFMVNVNIYLYIISLFYCFKYFIDLPFTILPILWCWDFFLNEIHYITVF